MSIPNSITRSESVAITFLGATHTVTGSRFLVTSRHASVLVDAGMFQGSKEDVARNREPFAIDPRDITAVALTHAHLDHCGYLPLLVKQGFEGKIYCTEYTAKLAEVVLADSARIQVEDAKYAERKGYSEHKHPEPLYNEEDVVKTIEQFSIVTFGSTVDVAEGVQAIFHPAGHILGAAFVEMQADDKRIVFTGDMGRPEHPVLVAPAALPSGHIDALVTESTYGDRTHESETHSFEEIITRTAKRGGSILIPAFAVDRTEVILIKLRELMNAGDIPKLPIYADSPMALTSLAYYREAINTESPEIRQDIVTQWKNKDPFDPGTLHEMRTVEDSKSLNDIKSPSIIVSASGMATGGRVTHHLAHMLPDARNTVMLVGFQANGTRGQMLTQGPEHVKIHGEQIPVRAEICQIQSFSVHADGDELVAWFGKAEKPNQVFVIHGETESAQKFATRLHGDLGWNAVVPEPGQRIDLT